MNTKAKIFIDGSAGTTGLRIFERLSTRSDIELVTLPDEQRKLPEARKEALNSCDIAFLCLPDDAAREAVAMTENKKVKLFDTSTAHRTETGWAYGFPELSEEHMEKIRSSTRIAVPGCHASGFIALIYPLINEGVVDKNAFLSCTSLTGYSGGGKKMIAEYESESRDVLYNAPRIYGLTQTHKHLKEMLYVTGLEKTPGFMPIVSDFYSGMCVSVVIDGALCDIERIRNIYKARYNTPLVSYVENADENGLLSAGRLSGLDSMQISVFGNEQRIMLCARYDNLGKGASGAAIECMNISLGLAPETGLEI